MRCVQADDRTVLDFPPGPIWHVLTDLGSYPHWWPKLMKLDLRRAEAGLVGSQYAVRPLGSRGFVCEIENVVPEAELRLRYIDGDYRGTGIWTLSPRGPATELSYRIDLEIADRRLAFFSYIVSIAALHSWLMRRIFAGLARQVAGQPS